MGASDHYREEAQRCRNLAASAPDAKIARRWHRLADEYAVLAEEIDASESGRLPAILRTSMQRQPVQQQQSKSRSGEKK